MYEPHFTEVGTCPRGDASCRGLRIHSRTGMPGFRVAACGFQLLPAPGNWETTKEIRSCAGPRQDHSMGRASLMPSLLPSAIPPLPCSPSSLPACALPSRQPTLRLHIWGRENPRSCSESCPVQKGSPERREESDGCALKTQLACET